MAARATSQYRSGFLRRSRKHPDTSAPTSTPKTPTQIDSVTILLPPAVSEHGFASTHLPTGVRTRAGLKPAPTRKSNSRDRDLKAWALPGVPSVRKTVTSRPDMRFSLSTLFDLGELPADLRRSLGLVYASSLLVIMGVNIVQQVLPAMIEPLGITDADVGLVIAVYTAPAIVLAPILGVASRPLRAGGRCWPVDCSCSASREPPSPSPQALAGYWCCASFKGSASAAVIPLTIVLIADLLEGRREVSGQGLKVFIDRVGELVLPPLGGALALVGWRWPFLSYAAAVPAGTPGGSLDAGDPGNNRGFAGTLPQGCSAGGQEPAALAGLRRRLPAVLPGLRLLHLSAAVPGPDTRSVHRGGGAIEVLPRVGRHGHVESGQAGWQHRGTRAAWSSAPSS